VSGSNATALPVRDTPVIVWGTYDLGKPRVRILLEAARAHGVLLYEIHADVWAGVEDKTQIRGWSRRLRYLLRWAAAYPRLLWRYLRCPRHELVFIPYMGHLDVVLLFPLARLRGARIVWDALLSLHGTVVEDRAMYRDGSPVAAALRVWDRLAFRCADHLLTGTRARAAQYVAEYHLDPSRITPIVVAAELRHFTPEPAPGEPPRAAGGRPRVLFYGQFSPLHGLSTVLEAARSEAGREWDWVLIGTGQEGWRIREWLERDAPLQVEWLHWVPYGELPGLIRGSDLCLGTFGTSRKALSGISNKIFQVLACGRPLLTADTPAVRELLSPAMEGVYLVPPGDAAALIAQLQVLPPEVVRLRHTRLHRPLVKQLQPAALGAQLAAAFDRARGTITMQRNAT